MNKKQKAGHGTLANTLFALRWQFKIAPGYTVFTFLQTVLGNVIIGQRNRNGKFVNHNAGANA